MARVRTLLLETDKFVCTFLGRIVGICLALCWNVLGNVSRINTYIFRKRLNSRRADEYTCRILVFIITDVLFMNTRVKQKD